MKKIIISSRPFDIVIESTGIKINIKDDEFKYLQTVFRMEKNKPSKTHLNEEISNGMKQEHNEQHQEHVVMSPQTYKNKPTVTSSRKQSREKRQNSA